MPTSQKTQQIAASFQRDSADEIASYTIKELEAALADLGWRDEGIQRSIKRRIDNLKENAARNSQSIARGIGYIVALAIAVIAVLLGARYL